MGFLDIFKRTSGLSFAAQNSGPDDPKWFRTEKDHFPRLMFVDPYRYGLPGRGGVIVVWHAGVRPQWVYVGKTDDLADAINDLREDRDVAYYERNGGLFVTWSAIAPPYRDGVVTYLRTQMTPMFGDDRLKEGTDPDAHPVPVLMPGQEPPPAK